MMKPSCSFSWWCSGMTRPGSRSTTAIVMRSPLMALAVMPSRRTYGLSSPSARKVLLNFAIDDRGRSQSPAAAHRLQAVAPVAPLQLVQQARHQHRPRGALRDLARVAGGDRVLGVEGRGERGGRLVGGVAADALVAAEDLVLPVRDVDGQDLGREVALLRRLVRAVVALDAELVH